MHYDAGLYCGAAVLLEARSELLQLFDESVGITGTVTLADLDGPVVVLSLQGRFWHERSMVLARVGHFLKQRIPVGGLQKICALVLFMRMCTDQQANLMGITRHILLISYNISLDWY